jgi:hypothetical protein
MRCQHCCLRTPPLCMHVSRRRVMVCAAAITCAFQFAISVSSARRPHALCTERVAFCQINCFACRARHAELHSLRAERSVFSHLHQIDAFQIAVLAAIHNAIHALTSLFWLEPSGLSSFDKRNSI